MTAEPAAPGAPAIILYKQVDRDDRGQTAHEDDYVRIKILTEEGRKYADIEIPYHKAEGNILNIHARTIKPDGSIVDFDNKVFTKTVVKAQGLKYLAKTFTLPAIQVGCIIEYFYTIDLAEDYIFDSHWILSDELFTKAADYSLNRYISNYENWHVSWIVQNLPPDQAQPKEGPDHVVRLHVTNIPAFPTEEFMPPANELKSRVDFTYSQDELDKSATHYWSTWGKKKNGQVENFLGKPKVLEQAVSETVGANDPPEMKLQKLYARVQQIRNLSYEVQKTGEEEKREKEKPASSAEEVWKHGYGYGWELTWLYLALVRAAGFDARAIYVADRQNYFFNPNLMQGRRLASNLVAINSNGKTIYCDPGAAFMPFGMLPWPETFVQGLQLDKKESTWVPIPPPHSEQARTERKADLTLTETGDLEGKLTVTYSGLEGATRRVEERNADATDRETYLEDEVKGYIPAASEVKLSNQPEWKNPALPLVAEFTLKVPGWASGAGRHVLVPAGLFGAREKHTFDHAMRVHPIYFAYPYSQMDDINIQLPAGWQISSLPKGWQDSGKVVSYALSVQNNHGMLHLTRSLTVEFVLMDEKYYHALRNYFQEIKTTDDEQIVLEPGAARAGN